MEYNGSKLFTEEMSATNDIRSKYLDSINGFIKANRENSADIRRRYISPEKLAADHEKYRVDYISMLGFPLNTYNTNMPVPTVKSVFVGEDDMGCIYRVTLNVTDNFDFTGVLFFPKNFDKQKKYPLVISQHGGAGTPELCSDFYFDTNYTHITRRALERGAVVFAPRLLLWDTTLYGTPYDRIHIDRQLNQLGGSITALEVFGIMRAVDYFTKQSYIDSDRVGMIGLSYGGFYTLMTAAADTRIQSAYSSCFFNDRFTHDWNDWIWQNAANTFLDAEIAALVAPRRLFIEVGGVDELFLPNGAKKEYDRLIPFFKAQNASENLRFKIHSGNHMLDTENDGFDFMFAKL